MRRFNGYMHGIDIGGWLSQCDYSKEHLDNFITEEDIKRIKGWGCDHVRVPVDYNIFRQIGIWRSICWIIISFRTKTAL